MARPIHLHRIKAAREQLLGQGVVPEGLLPESIERSWSRCANTGLSLEVKPYVSPLTQQEMDEIRDKNSRLLQLARPEIENLQAQLLGTQSMVILTDARGTILHTHGDPAFISKAERVALQPGVSWHEDNAGTNAIGTALIEQSPVFVMGPEHYFSQNAFLGCSAAPIADPFGQIIGVLDVSGDYRQPLEHTMALVRMSAQMIENRLFSEEFAKEIILHFHARPEFIGTLWEGIAVFAPDGQLLALNRNGAALLGLNTGEPLRLSFTEIFDATLAGLVSTVRRNLPGSSPLRTHAGQTFFTSMEPGAYQNIFPTIEKTEPSRTRHSNTEICASMLDCLDTGDAQMRSAIERVRKVLLRDIPILIEGETGTGKELLARAIHAGTSRKGPFVAINCAAIPEGLIEAELFGYEDGAFTGAKRRGASGKVQQANGGTLFLDEIGEMPLPLQARLLRVLQEREIVPLGSAKGVPIDIAVVSATNRKLRERVDIGEFREDLYYRLNGLRVCLPPLRDRSDLEALVTRVLEEESGKPLALAEGTLALFRKHPWRGNVRQLRNVLRAALAFLDEGSDIQPHHLPEDFVEELAGKGLAADELQPATDARLADLEADMIRQVLQEQAGNMTRAAKRLGISRATLYRKLKQMSPA